MPDHGQVVGDEQIGEVHRVLQFLHECHHLGLHRHIEGRDGLVADDEFGLHCQGAGYADALALATGELVGITVDETRIQVDLHQQFLGEIQAVLLAHVAMVYQQGFGDDVSHRQPGVQRRIGVLEDDLQFPAVLQHGVPTQGGDIHAIVEDRTGGRLVQLEYRPSRGRFSAPALAHQPEGLTPVDVEVESVDRLHQARFLEKPAADREMLLQSPHFKEFCLLIQHVGLHLPNSNTPQSAPVGSRARRDSLQCRYRSPSDSVVRTGNHHPM